MNSKFEAVIGLEVHAQLSTVTKIFCGCSTNFSSEPNSNVCPVCLGHPGVLPVLNKKVVEYAVMMGLATNCTINKKSILARKNYFYPDLPKGYQISQFEFPICENGFIEVSDNGSIKRIGITRIHIEEDAGKSIHAPGSETYIDVNRCGVPLIEIVSEPDMNSPKEAYEYLTKIKQLVKYLGICDANMEEGSLRCDANISVRPIGQKEFGTKTEIKNLNSFRNVEKALSYEIDRQIELLEDGEKVIQETLLWDVDLNEAIPMRSKEEAHDYRYFPDPDLMPIEISSDWEKELKSNLVELPDVKRKRFIDSFLLPEYDAEILTQTKGLASFYEDVIRETSDYKSASNWIMSDVLGVLNDRKIEIADFPISAVNLARIINLINTGIISSKIAKEIFPIMLDSNSNPEEVVKEKNLIQISDTDLISKVIDKVLNDNKDQVKMYLAGTEKVFGFFVGQVMKETKGKANPQIVNELIKSKLKDYKL